MAGSWPIGPVLRGIRGHRAAAVLIVVQLGIGLAITVLSILIGDYFSRRGTAPADFAEDELAVVELQLSGRSAGSDAAASRRAALLADVQRTPGCAGATTLEPLPIGILDRSPDAVRAGADAPPRREHTLDGGAGVAQVAGLHVVAGRDFVAEDLRSGGATAAIVTQDLAALMWLGRDPIGATFESRAHGPAVVVGVVDGMRTLLFGPEHARVLYAHEAPRSARFSLLVRSAPGRGRELHVALRDRLQQPGVHATVTSVAAEAARRSAPVGSVLGVLASMVGAIVVVVLIGSMGLTYYLVARRTREIGLRRAMGATRRDVIGELMLENLLLTAAGAVIGLAIVLFVLPALFQEQEEFHIKWSLVALSVAGVAALNLLATLVPASKAAAVPPVVASRTT